MYLFFDTETTGLPDFSKDLTDQAQPHIVQIAMLLTDDVGNEVMTSKFPIAPDGYSIDERLVTDSGKPTAFSIHRLGNHTLSKYGVQLRQALAMFRMYESRAQLKVAHNYRFDGFLLKSAHARVQVEQTSPAIDKYCTMKAITEVMKLPPTDKMLAAGFSGRPKSASLAEAYFFCTGKKLEKAHDALADVRACKDVFFWIKNNGMYKEQPRFVPGERAA